MSVAGEAVAPKKVEIDAHGPKNPVLGPGFPGGKALGTIQVE